jgi:hypothetical protein
MSHQSAPQLTPDQVDFFARRGFLSIDAITNAEEIAWLRGVYDELIEDESALRLRYDGVLPDGRSGLIHQIFLPERQCPALLETHYLAHARRLAATLLGVDLEQSVYGGLMLIYKPAGAGRDAPWHQDEAYWDFPTRRCHSLSVWMPLDDVTVDSGCMQFLPGSQTLDMLRHRRVSEGGPLVVDEPVDLSCAVPCPIPAGGATFHYCRTLHHTAANTSPRPRRAFTVIFHGPGSEREVPRPRPWL